jgi:hypothetical protein
MRWEDRGDAGIVGEVGDRDGLLEDAPAVLPHDQLKGGAPAEAAGEANDLAIAVHRRIGELDGAEIESRGFGKIEGHFARKVTKVTTSTREAGSAFPRCTRAGAARWWFRRSVRRLAMQGPSQTKPYFGRGNFLRGEGYPRASVSVRHCPTPTPPLKGRG